MSLDAIVVGSGPAGVAAAAALLRRGRRVLMLDAGLRLEPERQALLEAMAKVEPSSWTADQLSAVREGMEPGAEGIPLKRLFGSDFAFRETERFAEVQCRGSDLKNSMALGGLSNVWGAGAVPFSPEDIRDWPITIDELAPFYRECLEEMDLAAVEDDLAPSYPLYTNRHRPLQPSRPAAAFLKDLAAHRAALQQQGITFGTSRLAVTAPGKAGERGCVYCGLCLYGCPYGFIYNSADQVKAMAASPGFQYRPDVVVDRLDEQGGQVTLRARDRCNGTGLQLTARQVFLACGPIATTAILLDSLHAWDRPLEMKDSQYFLVPALRFRSTPGVENERLHTLAQAFLEVHDPAVAANGIHLSVYTYNDLLLAALQKQCGILGRLSPGLPRTLARRLLVFGGYLHSLDSPGIRLRLTRSQKGGRRVELDGIERPASARILKKLLHKLARNSLQLRALPLTPLARRGLPGRGFHFGGTFPMSKSPGEFQSDVSGRPHGFSCVHAVDATVFPSIPAPNLTLSVMANAKRIAAAAC